jgi:hypothetical protein
MIRTSTNHIAAESAFLIHDSSEGLVGGLFHRDALTGHRAGRVLGGALKNVLGCSCHPEPWADVGQTRFRVSFQRF